MHCIDLEDLPKLIKSFAIFCCLSSSVATENSSLHLVTVTNKRHVFCKDLFLYTSCIYVSVSCGHFYHGRIFLVDVFTLDIFLVDIFSVAIFTVDVVS